MTDYQALLDPDSKVQTAPSGRIDTHHHVVPPFYRSWLMDQGVTAGGKEIPHWDPQTALGFMDDTRVRTAVVSVSTPGVVVGNPEGWAPMARRVNEFAADLGRTHTGRFGFFATLTLPNIDTSLVELDYALDVLGAEGVVLLSNTNGVYLGDAAYEPLMAELNRRRAVVFIHPSQLPVDPLDGIPPYVADFLLDTTRAAINLSQSGTLTRYPDIRFILSHAGGFLPFAAARISVGASPNGDRDEGIALLRRFYFDTALSASMWSLPSLLAFADPTRILYGSDFPYAAAERSQSFTRALDEYDEIDHAAVDAGNAERLFPHLASVAGRV